MLCGFRVDGIDMNIIFGNILTSYEETPLSVRHTHTMIVSDKADVIHCGGIIIRCNDGYVNATAMCKITRKNVANFLRLDATKMYVRELSTAVLIPAERLIVVRKGGTHQGTWMHPRVATHFATWISTSFAVKVSGWLEQAKAQIPGVAEEYNGALTTLQADMNNQHEMRIRDALADRLSGRTEVTAEHGAIDIVTDSQVIEVKNVDKYTHALGQVLGHSEQFPLKERRVHLFGPDAPRTYEKLALAEALFSKYDILLTFETI